MLKNLMGEPHANLLVGLDTMDDAGVYRISDEIAMINTVDFITPAVDDPWWFGQIAAANSISDIYAMGGVPLTALNLVMFPAKVVELSVLNEIMRGGLEKMHEANVALVGGHSVEDDEPKYGLSVSGIVHPDKVIRNCTAQAGDALILTKPLGSGVLFNSVRAGSYDFKALERETLPVLASLNKIAMEKALNYEIHAMTDVTGFGILGHGMEMSKGSGLSARIRYQDLVFYEGSLEMYQKGETTGSNKANRQLVEGKMEIAANLTTAQQEWLFDPQTSGGLLISLPAEQAPALLADLHNAGIKEASIIGKMEKDGPPIVIE